MSFFDKLLLLWGANKVIDAIGEQEQRRIKKDEENKVLRHIISMLEDNEDDRYLEKTELEDRMEDLKYQMDDLKFQMELLDMDDEYDREEMENLKEEMEELSDDMNDLQDDIDNFDLYD